MEKYISAITFTHIINELSRVVGTAEQKYSMCKYVCVTSEPVMKNKVKYFF